MDNIVVFCATTRGHLHVKKDIPCQDASGRYEDPQGRFCAVAVADGHGDPTCMRSDRGSRIAVDAALRCIREFGESCLLDRDNNPSMGILDELHYSGQSNDAMRRLTDAVLARWYEAVMADVDKKPLSKDEMDHAASFATLYKDGSELEHAYGTTLIAALLIDGLLILLQQGDGRCVLLHEDGSASEPIPWDVRCYENVTTSVSDNDAAESFRHAIVHLNDDSPQIVACLLATDGVEDAFRNEEGRWNYHRQLCMKLAAIESKESQRTDFEAILEQELPAFSKGGSGDDVSVAGLANIRSLTTCRDQFDELIEVYDLNERLFEAQAKFLSMERMHSHLKLAARSGKKADEDAFLEYDAVYEQVKTQIQLLSDNINERKKIKEGDA